MPFVLLDFITSFSIFAAMGEGGNPRPIKEFWNQISCNWYTKDLRAISSEEYRNCHMKMQ